MALFSILGPRFPFIKGIAPAQPVLGTPNYVPPSVGQVSAADYASSTPSPEVGNAANAGSSVLPMVFALAQVEIELQQMMKSMRERRDTQHLQSTQQIAENLQKAQQLLAEAQQQHAATNQVLQQSLQLPFQPRKIEPMQMLEKMYNLENPWEVISSPHQNNLNKEISNDEPSFKCVLPQTKKGGFVNPYQIYLDEVNDLLKESPNDEQLKREQKRYETKVEKWDATIKEFEKTDKELYDYVNNLKLADTNNEPVSLVVFLVDGAVDGTKQAETNRLPSSGIKQYYKNALTKTTELIHPPQYQFRCRNDEKFRNHGVGNPYVGFEIQLYTSKTYNLDEALANEVGDVMFFMEHNELAVKSEQTKMVRHIGEDFDMKKYMTDYSSEYSFAVEKSYKDKKNKKIGKNYPLTLKDAKIEDTKR